MKDYKFRARIEAGDGGGAFVYFPFDAVVEFGTAGRVPIKATIDGVAYSGSLISYAGPHHVLLVLKDPRTDWQRGGGCYRRSTLAR